jgi:hypothetical protein
VFSNDNASGGNCLKTKDFKGCGLAQWENFTDKTNPARQVLSTSSHPGGKMPGSAF